MNFLQAAVAAWVALYGLIKVADLRSNGRITAALGARNISITPVQVYMSTKALNAALERIGKRHRRLLSFWFLLGVAFGFLGLFFSVTLLSSHLVSSALSPRALPQPIVRTLATPRPARPWWWPSLSFARNHDWLRDGQKMAKREFRKLRELRRAHKRRKRANLRGFHSRSQEAKASGGELRANPSSSRDREVHVPSVARFSTLRTQELEVSDAGMQIPAVARFVTEIKPAPPPAGLISEVAPPNESHPRNAVPAAAAAAPPNAYPDGHASDANPVGEEERHRKKIMLTPLLPGVNIPTTHMAYILISVGVAMAVHELGHALAAGMCDAHVDNVGAFLCLIFPGAYVELTGVEKLSVLRQLKVYCAGAWHNFVAAVLALLLVAVLPSVISPLYATGVGALVVLSPKGSPLEKSVRPGDVLLRLGRFDVSDGGNSFRSAVRNLVLSKESAGFCVPERMFRARRADLRCCEAGHAEEENGLRCFNMHGTPRRRACLATADVVRQHVCRRHSHCPGYSPRRRPSDNTLSTTARIFHAAVPGMGEDNPQSGAQVESQSQSDSQSEPQSGSQPDSQPDSQHVPHPGPRKPSSLELCFMAVLPEEQKLVDIRVKSARNGVTSTLFFEGSPSVLGSSVSVSSYVPRAWAAIPWPLLRLLALADLPNHLERLLQYFASISLALAVLNMAPVFRFDGEYSTMLFLKLAFPHMSSFRMSKVRFYVLRIGTGLLGLNVLVSLLQYDVQSLLPR